MVGLFPFEILREKDTGKKDELDHPIVAYECVHNIQGWLDMVTGSDEQTYQNSLLATSSHIFLSEDMSFPIEATDRIKDVLTGIEYEITFVDNVIGLSDHYEIYCKRWT